jgi:hypothetical protein
MLPDETLTRLTDDAFLALDAEEDESNSAGNE